MKLCINVRSSYEQGDHSNYQIWMNEINEDSATVNSVFNNHTDYIVQDLTIPAGRNQDFHPISQLRLMNLNDIEECHIVLNTHGAAGTSDLSDTAIKDTLKYLTSFDIPISGITALQCYGFNAETLDAAEDRVGYKLAGRQGSISLKSSSMKILQGKLNALELKTAQNFIIRGFDKSYDPIKNREEVIELLKGNGGKTLEVTTQQSALLSQKIQNIQEAIAYISSFNPDSETKSKTKDESKWNQSTNLLGIIFTEMLNDISNYFKAVPSAALNGASQLLYDKVKAYATTNGKLQADADFVSYKEFHSHYRNWGQANPLKNLGKNERLVLLNTYCDAPSIDSDNKTPCNAHAIASQFQHLGKFGVFAVTTITKEPEELTNTPAVRNDKVKGLCNSYG